MKAIATFLLCAISAPICHAVTTLGKMELLLDNDRVRVVRVVYSASAESGLHTHEYANRTAYFVKGGKLEIATGNKDDAPKILTVKDGDLLYLPAATHNVKNIGKSEVIIIEQELK